MRYGLVLLMLVSAGGCGGSGASAPSAVIVHELMAAPTIPLTAPVPIGKSATVTVQEQTCHFTARPNGPPVGGPGSCDPWYLPASLVATVEPMANTHQPCPLTVTQTAPGTLVVTRTGPGDPVAMIGNTSGACNVEIRDPQTDAPMTVILM